MRIRRTLFALLLGLGVAAPLSAQDIATMLQRVPASANVVATLDITGLIQSDIGASEGWSQKRTMDYYAGRVPFPPTAKMLVSATEFNPIERRATWQISIMNFGDKVDPYVVAKKEGSEVTWIDGLSVVPSRRNAYFVEFDRWNFGTYSPANRQQFARWVEFAKANKSAQISPYLINTAQKGSGFGQFNIVMDLSNLLDKTEVRARLDKSKVFTEAKADADAWSKFISEIKGLRLSVQATTNLLAELQFDFNENTKPYEQLFPTLLEEVAQRVGLGLSHIGDWKCQATGNSMVCRGSIQTDEVRHLISLVVPLAPNTDVDQGSISSAQEGVITSQRYFRAVDSMLKELRTKSDQFGAKQKWQASANWHEQTASRIDQLPNVNVDPELQRYAATEAGRVRVMAESLRGVNVQDKVLDSYKRSGYDYGGYGWGGYYGGGGYWSNEKGVDSAKAETAAKSANDRNLLWRMIGDDTTAIRQAMAKKYRVEF